MTRRSSFGPVLLAGLLGGALAAVAGANSWRVPADEARSGGDPVPGIELADPVAAAGEMPLALALGLVVLAAWGALLVTRGRVRRAVAGLAVLASAGYLATVVTAVAWLPERVDTAIGESARAAGGAAWSGWFWAAVVAAAMCLAATVVATAIAPAWPEMGGRYDAPGAERETPAAADQSHLDLWKSMDEGRDPTA